jgi:Ca-activated chloride channel family protein
MRLKNFLFLFFCTFFLSLKAQQEPDLPPPPTTRILFVFDASKSMYGRWQSGTKIEVAQKLMVKMLDSLQKIEDKPFQLALRVYGHQKPVPPQDCNDTKLEVGFSDDNIGRIKKALKAVQPKGTTPIARSLLRAATDFPSCDNCRNIIVLITDGIEACDEDPCAASRMLQKKGITLKPFVIGIGLDQNFKDTFGCVGQFFDASDEKTFKKVLDVVVSQALDNTTAQVNLLDLNKRPSETDVAMTFYNRTSGRVAYNFIHTMNYAGQPDTLILDPLVNYRLVVHTIPPVTLDSVSLIAGRHNHIGLSTPRGSLEIRQPGSRSTDPIDCIVRKVDSRNTLHVQSLNSIQKYLVGTYEVEILTLPRYVQTVTVDQVKTTTISIPPPGRASFHASSPGYGSIFQQEGDELIWVTDVDPELKRFSYELQPGNYTIIFRPKRAQNTLYSVSHNFSVSSGSSAIVKLK